MVYYKIDPQPHWQANQPQYWLSMQVAMLLGYAVSLPMNCWLARSGLKQKIS